MTKCSMERLVTKAMPTDYQVRKSIAEGVIAEREMEEEERDRKMIHTEVSIAKRLYGKSSKGQKKLPEAPMSHMDAILMLGKQCGIIKAECESDIYYVIEGDVLDSIRHIDLGCEKVGGYNFKKKGYTLRWVREPSANLEIKIKSDSPVKTLIFDGAFPPIEKGQHIRAAIYMIEKSEEGSAPAFRYLRNELKETEFAAAIKVIEKGKVVATYQNL